MASITFSYSSILSLLKSDSLMPLVILVLNSFYMNFLANVFYLFADSFEGASEITIVLNICSILGTGLCGYIVSRFNIFRSYQLITTIIGFSLAITFFLPPKVYLTNPVLENALISWIIFA
jgi:hypothetical protein